MAATDFASIQAALEQRIRNRITTQYNRSDVMANIIAKDAGQGKNLAWDITVGTATGYVMTEGQEITVFNADTELACTMPWGLYGDSFKITGLAEDVAAGDGTQLSRLFDRRLMQARSRAVAKINVDLYSGDGVSTPQNLMGLTASAGPLDSTGTYAGQNRSTYSQWGGNVFGNNGVPRALNLSLIEYALEVTGTASGELPTYGMTTPSLWRVLCELAGGEDRTNKDAYVNGRKLEKSMGFHSVEINGIPIFKDVSAVSGILLLLNDQHLSLQFLPAAPARVERGKILARVPLAGTPQEQNMDIGTLPPGGGPLFGNLIRLPANGSYDAWMIEATIQLMSDRSNAHAMIKDLAVS